MLTDLAAAPAAVKSAARVFRIIEFFDEIRRPARAKELADRLGIPQSSTSVLLASMVRLGYLDFDTTSRSYLPSLRTAVLATWRDTGCFRDGSMRRELEWLADESGLGACLTVRAGIHVRYLSVAQRIRPGTVHITLSARRFTVRSAAGIALLSRASEGEIRGVVHRTLAEKSIGDLTLGEVRDRVALARDQGYFVSYGLVRPENGAVAIALPGQVTGGWQAMALSLAGDLRLVEGSESRLVTLMREAIARLAHASGSQARGG